VNPRFDEDADLRLNLAALGPDALRELQDVLMWPQPGGTPCCSLGSADPIERTWRS